MKTRVVNDTRKRKVKGGRWEFAVCTCDWCRRVLERVSRSERPSLEHVSPVATPWAVVCEEHGRVFLTWHGYVQQMGDACEQRWLCPLCLKPAAFDGMNLGAFEDALAREDENERAARAGKKRGAGSDPAPRPDDPNDPRTGAR